MWRGSTGNGDLLVSAGVFIWCSPGKMFLVKSSTFYRLTSICFQKVSFYAINDAVGDLNFREIKRAIAKHSFTGSYLLPSLISLK